MGFYAPAQLVQSARRSGVEVLPVDIARSGAECSLEQGRGPGPALRLGFNLVGGLSAAAAGRLVAARGQAPFASVQDLHQRAALDARDLGALAAAGALASLAGNRHRARWAVAGLEPPLPVFPGGQVAEGIPLLRPPTEAQDIAGDYDSVGLTLGRHPLALLRKKLAERLVLPAEVLWEQPDNALVHAAGLVITRQRPGSASGVIFVTLEDETGTVNLVVWKGVGERYRRVLLESRLLGVWGRVQRQGDVLHVVAARLLDHSELLGACSLEITVPSRDFH